jgi:hypothetical protein
MASTADCFNPTGEYNEDEVVAERVFSPGGLSGRAAIRAAGLMSVLALIDPRTSGFWRASLVIVGLGGAVTMVVARGFPVPPGRGAAGERGLPGTDWLGLAAYLAAIVLYVPIAALALVGGGYALCTEAVVLTIMVFLGFNVAWLLLLGPRAGSSSPAADR